MKIVKILSLSVLSLVVVFGLMALLAPTHYTIESTTRIKATPELVFNQVRSFTQYPLWSPWKESDPLQQTWVEGADGQPGARFYWSGKEGAGYQTLLDVVPHESIGIQCFISTPFEAQPTFRYQFAASTGGETVVTQIFNTDMPVPANVFGWLFGVKADISRVNARGLERLKAHCEQTEVSAAQ